MANTQSVFGTELKEKLNRGIKQLNDTVSATLGPGGRTVLIKDQFGEIKATKDGVSVSKSFTHLEDDVEDMGAQLIKQVSIKSANEAGDGTTTSTLLAASIIDEGIKNIRQGSNPIEVKKGIDEATKQIIKTVKQMSKQVETQEQIEMVATISGNNDEEIGKLISNAIEKVGREGVITVEESKIGETSLEIVEGMQFDKGYKSPYFVTDNNTMQAHLDDPYILIYNGRITNQKETLQALTIANAENRSILIIAEDFGEEALAGLIVNKMRGIVSACAVKAPDFGERRTLILEDLAILTGGQVLSKEKGHALDRMTAEQLKPMLGNARLATIAKGDTTIVDGKGSEDDILHRAEEIKAQIDKAQSMFEKEKLQERLGKIAGGVAIINVGGNSEIEMREKKDRVEDAMYAAKAALVDGIVTGGGWALYKASESLMQSSDMTPSQIIGFNIVKEACKQPFKKILSNCGIDNWYDIAARINSSEYAMPVYNAKKHVIVDSLQDGIIDPAKVVITAITNAASVASTILTTEAIVYDKKDESKSTQDPMMGMAGMM